MRSSTMKSCRSQIVSLILAGLISMPAHAEVIPCRWEKVADLDLGTHIIVELKNGDQVEEDFEGLSESEMDIETHSARAVIPKGDIQTITTQKRSGVDEGAKKNAALVESGCGRPERPSSAKPMSQRLPWVGTCENRLGSPDTIRGIRILLPVESPSGSSETFAGFRTEEEVSASRLRHLSHIVSARFHK